MMKRRNRQVSWNAFKPTCDLQPFIDSQEPMLTSFQASLLLMKILKKHETLIFANKEQEVKTTMNNLTAQNQVLQKIRESGLLKKKKVLLSSFKVLEQLDVNKKQAYKALEQENNEIADRIFALQFALQRMNACKKNDSLTPEYLQKLQAKVKHRKKIEKHFIRLVNESQQKNEDFYEKQKKQIQDWVMVRHSGQSLVSRQEIENDQQLKRLSEVIEAIFNKLD